MGQGDKPKGCRSVRLVIFRGSIFPHHLLPLFSWTAADVFPAAVHLLTIFYNVNWIFPLSSLS
jgi:hypothetical protein